MSRILAIEDSKTVVRSLAEMLAPDGHSVETVLNLNALPGYLRQSPPDLILLDLELPEMPGIGWAHLARTHHRQPIKCIIYSSKPWAQLVAASRLVNAVDFLSKGAPADTVRRTVNNALRVSLEGGPSAHRRAAGSCS